MAYGLARSEVADLANLAIFGGVDEATLSRLALELDVITLEAGDCPITEGAAGRELFVVLEGSLEAFCKPRERERERDLEARGALASVADFGPGALVGEQAVLDMMPRSATVRARGHARLLRVPAAKLDQLYRRDPRAYALVMMNLAREVSRKLRATCDKLVQAKAELGDLTTLPVERSARYAVAELDPESRRQSSTCLQAHEPRSVTDFDDASGETRKSDAGPRSSRRR